MSYHGEIENIALLVFITVSAIGVADMVYRWEKGEAHRELKQIKKPTPLTEKIVEEYRHFFEIYWWHWASIATLIICIAGLAF
tara:strand:- start:1220 stop:1468 length:249 start_codon:yes stop_codon:yes gene_type:complete